MGRYNDTAEHAQSVLISLFDSVDDNAGSALKLASGYLGTFWRTPGVEPEYVTQRVGYLSDALKNIWLAFEIDDRLQQNRELRAARLDLMAAIIDLSNINAYYLKNSARCAKLERAARTNREFTKPKDHYQLSTPMIYDYQELRHRNLFREELGEHYEAYTRWHDALPESFKSKNHSTAYLATRFLLEEGIVRAPAKAPNKKIYYEQKGRRIVRWEKGPPITHPDEILLRFRDNYAWAWYQLRGNLALPGLPLDDVAPTEAKLHTLRPPVYLDGGWKRCRSRRRGAITHQVEMPLSLKYAMRHDEIYIDPNTGTGRSHHSYLVDEKSVQAAGGIVASLGKVIAIDNVSGHYEPGYRLLSQAVRLIESKSAFHASAVVGVIAGTLGIVRFVPVKIFKEFARARFDPDRVRNRFEDSDRWPFPSFVDDELLRVLRARWLAKDSEHEREAFLKAIHES